MKKFPPIPLVNLKREYTFLENKMHPALMSVIQDGRFIHSTELEEFEKKFAVFCNAPYCVGVANGTAAIFLALIALGISKGDEVITTTMSFNATAEAILHAGAVPRFVDVDEGNLSIDTSKIEQAITKKTKAIIVVHLYGIPVELDSVKKICRKYQLALVEDCAQAQGSYYKDRHVGITGDVGCFSFMPAKNLGAYGDAGCIITKNKKIAQIIYKLRDHGRISKYVHDTLGYAERLDNLQAAVLLVKLPYLTRWNNRRRAIAKRYTKGINKDKIKVLSIPENTLPNFYTYVFLSSNRDSLKESLEKHNIATNIYYPLPLHMQPMFQYLGYAPSDLPVAQRLSQSLLSIPMNPFLSDEEVDYIIQTVNTYA